jgi:polysaccharide export outer membrane protein
MKAMAWRAACAAMLAASSAHGADYKVGAGDELTVQVYQEPSLTVDVVVSDECTITLGLIGRVQVCAQTTDEVAAAVRDLYDGDYLVDPTIAVRVKKYHSQRVDVLGEVARPGPQYLDGETTLIEAISLAGGPKADNVIKAEIVGTDGQTRVIDLTQVDPADPVEVRRGDKIYLKPGEVVYVEGQIARPGVVTLSDGLTVTRAIALAGGAAEYANLRRVMVRRADGQKVRVNVQRVQRGVDDDPVLASDDHLVVPRGGF